MMVVFRGVDVAGWRWLTAVALLAGLGAGFGAPVRAAQRGTVVVPRVVGQGVLAGYAGLHAAGLRVSIPHGVSFVSSRPPKVARSSPPGGRRVARGSVVTLYLSCCARASAPLVPKGRLPSYRVPRFAGKPVRDAYLWATQRKLGFRAYLGGLKAGAAPGLFANYRVTRQAPGSGVWLAVAKRTRKPGGRRTVVKLTPLSVWGAQTLPCTPPVGYKLVASSPEAVIMSFTAAKNGIPYLNWYGCLRAVGKITLLGSASEEVSIGQVALAGSFLALSVGIQSHELVPCTNTVQVYDLRTGKPGQTFAIDCSYPELYRLGGIDSLSVNSHGFAAWRVTRRYPQAQANFLHGISCPSVSLCVAIDNDGNVLNTTDPTGGRNAWRLAAVGVYLNALACPSTSLCVGAGSGEVLTSTTPTGGAGNWAIARVQNSGMAIRALSCPSTSLCVGVDDGGNVVSSTNPTGGPQAWRVTPLPGGSSRRFGSLSCPSVSLCVATAAGTIITSTNPTGGPDAWAVTHVPGNPGAIACPSVSLCVARQADGSVLISTDPTGGAATWTTTNIASPAGPGGDISCPSENLCVADQGDGSLLISTNPTGGSAAWTTTTLPRVDNVTTALACPTINLCLVADASDGGPVHTTTDPTGGRGAWSTTFTELPPTCNNAIPCTVAQVYAFDNHGTRLLDTGPPPGANGALSAVTLSGNRVTWFNEGVAHQATLG